MNTCAPSSAKVFATAFPNPLLEAVTMTDFPFKPNACLAIPLFAYTSILFWTFYLDTFIY